MEYTSYKSPGLVRWDNLLQAYIESDPDFLHLELEKRVRAWKRLGLKGYRRRAKAQKTRVLIDRITQAVGMAAVCTGTIAIMAVLVYLA